MTAKLVGLRAQNFMKLELVDLRFEDQHYAEITGANGAGKSAYLDSLFALLGGKSEIPGDPVRHGADEALLSADLSDYTVSLRIDPDRTPTLVVKNRDGFKISSPQKLLDGLKASLGFDPEAFSRMTPTQQRDQLAELVGLKAMLDNLAMHDRAEFEERTNINRDAKRVQAQLDAIPEIDACQPVDVSALIAEIRQARADNDIIRWEAERRESRRGEMAKSRAGAASYRAEAERLLNLADQCEADADAIDNELSALDPAPPFVDVASLESRVESAESTNAQARTYAERQKLVNALHQLKAESDALTASMQQREAERARVLAAAEFPVPGLSLTESCVMYNGVTFDQASSGERVLVSASVGMRLNPALRVMLIRDGSRLDSQSRKVIAELARTHDFLVIVEVTDDSGDVGIYIEDGRVAAIDGVAVAA